MAVSICQNKHEINVKLMKLHRFGIIHKKYLEFFTKNKKENPRKVDKNVIYFFTKSFK